ncbi:NAD(P)H-binding protein [Pseudonocardia nematodicida]|uniref:NAD(P)H-binding protein n=1 Tax=Pseudonocardia nematodicida TaxID=1206997 RepID=A0ABV1KAX9_9PSEU
MRVVIPGGNGKTGRAVVGALRARDVTAVPLGRGDVPGVADAAYLIAPNMHPDEPALVAGLLDALRAAGVSRVVYHSVASPYAPDMPHHLGKARAEDLVRRSGLSWTILQPGPYLQNLDLTAPVRVPYDVHAVFGFADLREVAEAAATVLTEPGHEGATYELASRTATVAGLAAEAGATAERVPGPSGLGPWFDAMFAYYDRHGLPVGTRTLAALLGRGAAAGPSDTRPTPP